MNGDIYTYLDKNLYAVSSPQAGEGTTASMSVSAGSGGTGEVPFDRVISGDWTEQITMRGGFFQSSTFGVAGAGGWQLRPNNVNGDSAIIFKNSSSSLEMTEALTFLVSTTQNADIRVASGSSPISSGVDLRITVGGTSGATNAVWLDLIWTANNTGKFVPGSGDTMDLGDSSQFFNEINYKTLTDRGCLGWFDEGVEMQDGRKLVDTEAILAVKKHPTRKTIYGVDMLDYSSMPKAVYKPAPVAKEDIRDTEGKLLFKKGEKIGQDGAETTALISIMFGAIKELTHRVKDLEKQKEV